MKPKVCKTCLCMYKCNAKVVDPNVCPVQAVKPADNPFDKEMKTPIKVKDERFHSPTELWRKKKV